MHKLLRFYNQNRGMIIAIIGTILLIIIIIQILNSLVKQKRENEKQNVIANQANSSTNSTTISPSNTSVINGKPVKELESDSEIIKRFVKYCNEGEIENAYNMLTEECKTRIYPSLERFKTMYIDRIFTINRMYSLENWYSTSNFATYHIKYTDDVLASGNAEGVNTLGDYITVAKAEGQQGLNIGSYIGYKERNKPETVNGITVSASRIYLYMDYTIVNVKVKNGTNNTISIDPKENANSVYLYDTNGVRYTAFLNENSAEELLVRRNMEINVDIKFNKMYNPDSRTLKGLTLNDVVLNYENYKNGVEEKNSIKIDARI